MTGVVNPARVCSADARIVQNRPLCDEHVAVEAELDHFPSSEPGQFLEVLCSTAPEQSPRELTCLDGEFPKPGPGFNRTSPLLRRPFSIADHVGLPGGGARLTVISRTIGVGTEWLEHVAPGDTLNLTGPLGRGFRIPDEDIPVVLVGGGVGIPPLLYLARRLHERRRAEVLAIFGALRGNLLPVRLRASPDAQGRPSPCAELPGDAPFPVIVTTDDGSLGLCGRVTDALRSWHQQTRPPWQTLVCACGPEPMLRAVAAMTRELRMRCQLCVERMMGCGIGTCLSCVVRVRDPRSPQGWRWAVSCTEGPVFDRDELLDYDTPTR
jgi:dihydroorotate dehydrogenase electron transfer subunit